MQDATVASSWAKPKKEEKPIEAVQVSFERLSSAEPVRFLKIAVHGKQKTGKTRFCLTAPSPIYVISTEPGLKPLMRLFPNKEIYYVDVYEADQTGVFEVEATKTLEKVDAAVKLIREKVKENPQSVGTVVVDSVTDIWKWVQEWMKTEILKIDKTARVRQQWDWQFATNKYQNIIMQLLSLPTHLILTAQDKEEYAGPGEPSGVFVPRWQAQTPFWVDIVIGFVKYSDPKDSHIVYNSTIEDSRHMDDLLQPIAGKQTENPTYDKLALILKQKAAA